MTSKPICYITLEGNLTQSRSVNEAASKHQNPFLTLSPQARAYYLSSNIEPENLARADASLRELLDSVDGTSGKVCFVA